MDVLPRARGEARQQVRAAEAYKEQRELQANGDVANFLAVLEQYAGVLLLGGDNLILSTLPHHRTDLILRKVNLDRYDDRDLVRTNLIDSYDRIIAFVQKNLPDPFYLAGVERIPRGVNPKRAFSPYGFLRKNSRHTNQPQPIVVEIGRAHV